jgi:hypothetical protein
MMNPAMRSNHNTLRGFFSLARPSIPLFSRFALLVFMAFSLQARPQDHLALNRGIDTYWDTPDKTFEQRRVQYLNYCIANPVEGRKASFNQLARLALGEGPLDERIIRGAVKFIYSNQDCNDFTVGGFLRMLYLYKGNPLLLAGIKSEIEKCLLDFKYWWSEPGIDRRCYHTENHQIIYHSDELLAGQLFKDQRFNNDGKTGREHIEHAKLLIERWMDFRVKFGFSEWLSNNYFDADLMALANLHDFAEDPQIRNRAQLLIDVMMFEMALNNYKGVFGSTHGRASVENIKGGRKEPSSCIMKLMFGVGVFNSSEDMGAISLASSSYRCPEIIRTIGTDYRTTSLTRERQSINLDDAPKYGLSYDNELDCHLYWSIQDYAYPKILEMSKVISEKYKVRQQEDYEQYDQKYENQIKQYGKIINRDVGHKAITEVNFETYRTSDYMLSCAQSFRPGRGGFQQHIWQATLGIDAVVFTNHPGSVNEATHPNYWAGNGIMPRAAQSKNVLCCIYHIPSNDPLPFSHAYVPAKHFDEIVERGNWIFGRKADGYIALYSQNPWYWKADKEGNRNEVRVDSPDNTWICEMGSKEQWKNFERFVKEISSSEIRFDGHSLVYQSPTEGKVQFGWEKPLLINDKVIDLKYERFDNPYCQNRFLSKKIVIKQKNRSLTLDFDNNTRVFQPEPEQSGTNGKFN